MRTGPLHLPPPLKCVKAPLFHHSFLAVLHQNICCISSTLPAIAAAAEAAQGMRLVMSQRALPGFGLARGPGLVTDETH